MAISKRVAPDNYVRADMDAVIDAVNALNGIVPGGSTTQVLHGPGSATTWSAVSLTADVSGILPGLNGGTGNGFFAVAGPATSLKTFTYPNASAMVLTDNAAVTVAQGGTGVATLALNGVLYGNAASAVLVTAQGAANTVLMANAGAPVFSAAPTIGTSVTTPLVIGGTGTTSPLTLRSTTGVGVAGADIIFQAGNNGATEIARFLNVGTALLGAATALGTGKMEITNTSSGVGTVGLNLVNAATATSTAISLDFTPHTSVPLARINANRTNAVSAGDTDLEFYTYAGSLQKRFVVTSAGNFGFLVAAPATAFHFGSGHLTLGPLSGTTAADFRLRQGSNTGVGYVGFKAPDGAITVPGWAGAAAGWVWTLPNADGTVGQVLKTDGVGNLGWAANAASGMSNPMTTIGDLIYASATGSPATAARLAIGTAGQVLTVSGGLPVWGSGAASATAAGADTQVQYNNAGSFGASANFTWDNTASALTLSSLGSVGGTKISLALRNSSAGLTATNELRIGNNLQADAFTAWNNSSTFTGAENYAYLYNRLNAPLLLGANNIEKLRINTTGSITLASALSVPNGGTGVATLALNGVLYGNGTGVALVTAQGAANTVLTANAGAPVFSAAPTIGTSVTTPLVTATTAVGVAATFGNTAAVNGYIAITPNSTTGVHRLSAVSASANADLILQSSKVGVLTDVLTVAGSTSFVGIGTTPMTLVEIRGTGSDVLRLHSTHTGGVGMNLEWYSDFTPGKVTGAIESDASGASGGSFFIKVRDQGTNALVERMRIENTGNFNIGGNATPTSLFSVGSTSQFQVNSTGAIAAVTSITASGVITAGIGTGTGTTTNIGVANVQTSSAGVGNGADTTDDTLFTYSLPLNSMSGNGKSIRVRAWGSTAANANNKQIKLWFAGTAIVVSGVTTLNAKNWDIEMEVTRITATTVSAVGTYEDGTSGLIAADIGIQANLTVSDLTANASIIKVTGASSTTGAASDVLGYAMKTWFEN